MMHRTHSKSLRARVRLEIAERSPSAAFTFAFVAVIALIRPFVPGPYENIVRLGAAIALAASLFRYHRAQQVLSVGKATDTDYRLLSIAIALNSVGWSLVFSASTYGALVKGESYYFPTFVMIAFASGSVISLSSARYLSQTFVGLNLGTQLLTLAYARFVKGIAVEWELLLVYPVGAMYLAREARLLRRQLIARHINQIRLEIANRRLFRSRQELVDQTARTVHASRLASLGEMAGGVAHEINNPLAIIHLSLESFQLQLKRTATQIDSKALETIRRCQAAVDRISAIVRGLKNFSRAGDQDPLVPVTIRQLMQDTMGLCAEKLKAHQVKFQLEGDLDAEVLCRPVEIAQVLINLVNNAFYVTTALPPEERCLCLEVREEAQSVCVRMTNTGAAITPAAREKLFQPFFTTKPPGEGTGLGLSISRAIAKRHGGDLSLDEGAKLTTFVLRLPRHERSGAPAEL